MAGFWSTAFGWAEEITKGVSKLGIPGISQAAGLYSFAADRAKDMAIDMQLGELSSNIGDLRNGLDAANAKIDAQGKALRGAMDGLKSELEGALKQQGEKFDQEIKAQDAKIAALSGEQKRQAEECKKALQRQKQELESKINEVTENLTWAQNQLRKDLDNFKNEVNERFEKQEKKILENKRKIEEEKRQREAEIREVKDKIKIANTKIENLQQEKDELQDNFNKYQFQTNQKINEVQTELEDTQAEFQSKLKLQETKYQNDLAEAQENFESQTKIVEAQIKDTREVLEEQEEELSNIKYEQKKSKLEQQQIFEELQETNDILHFQKHKLDFVANQMEEIHEEVHERMDKLSQKLDQRTNEALNIAQDTNKKVDKLTEEVKNIQQTTEQLQEQIKKNKQDTQQVKEDAKLTNERLDNLLKIQALSDYSAEQSKINKIEKSLELKAEEAKLLATLNLLKETKQLIPLEFSEREWKVGIQEGTEKEMPRPEGFPLSPNSRWAKMYTPEQLQEWGWDIRLLGDNETAPLKDEDKRKPKQIDPSSNQKSEEGQEEKKETDNSLLEKFTELEKETLERLQDIQQEINHNIQAAENSPPPPPSATQQKFQSIQQKIQEKKQQLKQKQQEIKNLEKKPFSAENQQQLKQVREEQKEAEKQLQESQTQLSDPSFQFEQELEKFEEQVNEDKKEEVEQQWSTIQALSQQALQEQTEEEKEEKEQQEHETDKKLEELTQQLKEMEQTVAASQKQMTKFMLFLIIFLMEYVVYKKNGLPGLVILNIILAIAYYHRDTLKEYSELWGKYLLILGYVMGNVLAYSAPEQEKYKWPSVIGFNLAILGIYAYTLYQQKQEQAKIEAHYQKESQKISQEAHLPLETLKQIPSEDNSWLSTLNPLANIHVSQRAEQFRKVVKEQLAKQELAHQKELEIQQQTETLQKATEIEQKLKVAQANLSDSPMTWDKIKERYPEFVSRSVFLKELEKADKLLSQNKDNEPTKSLAARLGKIPLPNEEEQQLLAQLYLTPEQFIVLSCQAQYLTPEEREEITNNYSSLTTPQKLQLLNAGLNNLGVNTSGKKKIFVELNHTLYHEKKSFGLTTPEKEGVLRLLINTLNLSQEQRNSLENMGVSFFDASNWQVSEEQKENLLKFGLSRIELTEEQQTTLTQAGNLKNFPLSPQQKNILTSLSPLLKENRYSEESLELINSLNLKFNSLSFLVNNQIIPNPHTDFGQAPNPYLTLKNKFLDGEQKELREEAKVREKQIQEEEIQEQKMSIVHDLLKLLSDDEGEDLNISLSLDNWVKIGVLQEYQKNILLTLGFKTIPRYHYFELLIFAIENFTDYSWGDLLEENTKLEEDYQKYLNSLKNQPITINKTIWEKFVSSKSKKEQAIFKDLNLEELINEKINQALAGYQPKETFYDSQEELSETEEITDPKPTPSTSRYDNLFENLNQEEAERQRKKQEREEARKKLEAAELKRREDLLSEKDRKLKEQEERRQKEKELAEQEEKKRQELKEAREKALREEQETHLANQKKIIEEQQKSREEAFKNQQKEAELAEQKKKAEIENLEKQNKFAQEQLEKQKELLEKETQEKLAKIAAEDQAERQKILKQQKEREIALENEKKENERNLQDQKQRWEDELKKLKQDNEKELQEAKNKLDADKKKAEEELNRLKEEEKLAKDRQAKDKIEDEKRKHARIKEFEVSKLQAKAWEELTNYSLGHDEVKFGTLLDGKPVNYHFQKSRSRGGYVQMPSVKEIFAHYPGVKIKLVGVEDLKDKLRGDRAMTMDDVKNVVKLANRYPGFYTEEEWRQKIKELDEVGLLE